MFSKYIRALFYTLIPVVCVMVGSAARAQSIGTDTLRITLPDAEDLFLKNNLSLIAQRYNIADAQAQVITAKLFNNPEIQLQHGLYNPTAKKFFDTSHEGQEYQADVSQLITTAGKRNKNIQLANLNVQLAQYQFFDLLRTLRYTLRTDFFQIYYQQQSAKVYAEEISSLSKILKAFQEQYAKGNIAQKEVLRIQSQLYTLQTEQATLQNSIDDVQSEFKLLLKADPKVYVSAVYQADPAATMNLQSVAYPQLLDSAYTNRADLKAARTAVDYSNTNLRLQKANAVPDITILAGYDKQGNYIRDYNYVGIAMPLPFFNRNQGGIKQARIAVDASKTQLELQQDQVQSQLANSYQSAIRLDRLANSFDPKFKTDFNHLIDEVFKNYQRRNISLLEFLDFYDSYKSNTLQLNTLQQDRANSLEQLNYVTGTSFFNKQ
ncbi:TolC family protein [Mucilaginibacter sp. Bleaf8]|uniref:TolC family protein n=1 Tax=Mucilaginibacter sp. Bleaf8 TaxID=2834430 RepID=UPI001BCCB1B5|nr:TolC family protein [Mucilaginibacter sp. Bleaf8]MBS7564439.1 TolC family protein [Mucilaginibacter sp. Bleaf8]